ncbi:glyoxalase superfamily protein [Pleionea sediminis]|uniref:glyoxalase superfamily protein n=1 Tax=Pleionea sediminis TaxID=2569479 RepID=UPI001184D522|nr:glyoxalase superfamily protein [Pleionea sediminis]
MSSNEKQLSSGIKSLKAQANRLKKSKGISHTKALNLVAQENGYNSWKHLLNDTPKDHQLFLKAGYTEKALNEIINGNIATRISVINVDKHTPSEARAFICEHLRQIKKTSPNHGFFHVSAFISEELGNQLKSPEKFVFSIQNKFSWLNLLRLIEVEGPLDLEETEKHMQYAQLESSEMIDEIIENGKFGSKK